MDAKPAVGETPGLERWAEFLQNGEVKGREVVTIVPATAIKQVAKEAPPRPGTYQVDVLKESKYVRIWIHRQGDHYLFNLHRSELDDGYAWKVSKSALGVRALVADAFAP